MKTTIIHKGKERTWEGLLANWERHKEYIMGWCDGREVLVNGHQYTYIAFDCSRDIYSFKPEKVEPVVFAGLKVSHLDEVVECSGIACDFLVSRAGLANGRAEFKIESRGDALGLDPHKQYKITIEEV